MSVSAIEAASPVDGVPSRWRFSPPLAAWLRLVHASCALTDALVTWQLPATGPTPDFTVAGVYHRRNAPVVERLIAGVANVRLWALDEPADGLADLTIGSGAGKRMEHLNRLCAEVASPYVVLVDDDAPLVAGSIARLVEVAARHRLDLCQPAQAPTGHWSHAITLRRPMSAVRLTNFVEVGPVVVIGPRLREAILPFPADSGQGWGLDADWSRLCDTHGARLGIVDAVEMLHLHPPGRGYAQEAEQPRLDAALEGLGANTIASFAATRSVVRPWRI